MLDADGTPHQVFGETPADVLRRHVWQREPPEVGDRGINPAESLVAGQRIQWRRLDRGHAASILSTIVSHRDSLADLAHLELTSLAAMVTAQ